MTIKGRTKGLAAVITGAAIGGLVIGTTALSASAKDYPISPSVGPTVLGTVARRADAGTAFTGANVMLGFVALAALVVVGIGALYIARRRTAASGS